MLALLSSAILQLPSLTFLSFQAVRLALLFSSQLSPQPPRLLSSSQLPPVDAICSLTPPLSRLHWLSPLKAGDGQARLYPSAVPASDAQRLALCSHTLSPCMAGQGKRTAQRGNGALLLSWKP